MDDNSSTAALEQSLTKLFIGDVPASVTSEDLRECLEKFGELDECVVKQGSGEQGTRFAFVWSDAATAAKILAQPHTIGDAVIPKPVLAKRQQRLAKDVKSLGSAPIIPDKIFVGGLSNETTVDDFRVAAAPHRPHVLATHPAPLSPSLPLPRALGVFVLDVSVLGATSPEHHRRPDDT